MQITATVGLSRKMRVPIYERLVIDRMKVKPMLVPTQVDLKIRIGEQYTDGQGATLLDEKMSRK